MRHLFVPACVCVMTLSGSTATSPIANLDSFAGTPAKSESRVTADTADAEQTSTDTPRIQLASADTTVEAWTLFDAARRHAFELSRAPSSDIKIPSISQDDTIVGSHENEDAELREVEGPPAPPPKPVVHRSRREVCDALATAAEANNLPAPFFIRLLLQESGFRPGVVSPVGAQGVAQFMPDTAARMGLDNPFDPLQAIPASARLLRNLFEKFGNLGLAAAAYNAGPKRIHDWLAKKGKLPDETRGYVKIITGKEAENWRVTAAAGIAGIKLPRIAPCQEEAGLHAWNGPSEIPMPPPNPATRGDEPVVADATPAKHRKHDVKHEPKPEVVAHASAADRVAVKQTRDGKRMTAVIAVKPGRESTHGKHTRTASNDKLKIMRPEQTTLQLAAQKTKGPKAAAGAATHKRTAAAKSSQPLRIANAGR